MSRKSESWPERLNAFIESRREQPFQWGVNDCALFICDAIEVLVDVDPACEFRGKYDSTRGALRAIRVAGFTDLEDLAVKIAQRYEFAEIDPPLSRRGDVVLCDIPGDKGMILSLVGTSGELLTTGEFGLVELAPQTARRAWRVE